MRRRPSFVSIDVCAAGVPAARAPNYQATWAMWGDRLRGGGHASLDLATQVPADAVRDVDTRAPAASCGQLRLRGHLLEPSAAQPLAAAGFCLDACGVTPEQAYEENIINKQLKQDVLYVPLLKSSINPCMPLLVQELCKDGFLKLKRRCPRCARTALYPPRPRKTCKGKLHVQCKFHKCQYHANVTDFSVFKGTRLTLPQLARVILFYARQRAQGSFGRGLPVPAEDASLCR